MTEPKGAILSDLTWPEVEPWLAAPVIVPVGAAAKEHGPHLPMGTDAIVADALARRLAARLPVLVAPTLTLGYYPVFRGFAGSQHLRAETFVAVVEDVLRGFVAQGAEHLVLLNTGVSTEAPLGLAVQNVFDETGVRPAIADLRLLGKAAAGLMRQRGGGHADEAETSLMLALAPALVRFAKAPAYGEPDMPSPPGFRRPIRFRSDAAAPLPDRWPTGTSGEPQRATLAKGEAILAAILADLEAGLRQWFPAALAAGATCGSAG
ncbi:MAG: creatininase family protein [Alphaproteobacteria bacterium]|nr:creatininase family protein [Alphaproteobacteria bacterium]MCB9930134.1 creatininase family protein [Alphaproteobacteria bacterium]